MLNIHPEASPEALEALRQQVAGEYAAGLLTQGEASQAQAQITYQLLRPKVRARGFRSTYRSAQWAQATETQAHYIIGSDSGQW